jgi:hypothetical protein
VISTTDANTPGLAPAKLEWDNYLRLRLAVCFPLPLAAGAPWWTLGRLQGGFPLVIKRLCPSCMKWTYVEEDELDPKCLVCSSPLVVTEHPEPAA